MVTPGINVRFTMVHKGIVTVNCLAIKHDNDPIFSWGVHDQSISWLDYHSCHNTVVDGVWNLPHNYSTSLDLHTSGMTLR